MKNVVILHKKPLARVDKLVRSSSREGDTILDPFVGSGTTAIVAQGTGRKWVAMEKNPDYVRMTREALAKLKDEGVQSNFLGEAGIGLGNC